MPRYDLYVGQEHRPVHMAKFLTSVQTDTPIHDPATGPDTYIAETGGKIYRVRQIEDGDLYAVEVMPFYVHPFTTIKDD